MSIDYTALATTALGFTVALAWNKAVSDAVNNMLPTKTAAQSSIASAVMATILVMFIIAVLNGTRKIVDEVEDEHYASRQISPLVRIWHP